ncbi:MAG TPA: VCBS repeat-containing protein [Terriglobia bacterium]|nr:VCBS repeat-containing protein [Terriglobia bacterium]
MSRPSQPLKWREHPVAKIPSGYQAAVAEVNGDGKLDILALSSEQNIVEWYENPSWKLRPISTGTPNNISLAPLLWKGYAGHGLALATDFYLEESSRGGNVWWAQPDKTLDSEWKRTLIGTVPTSHRLRWGDFDGDGRPELLDIPLLGAGAKAPEYSVGAALTYFRIPDSVWHNEAAPRGEPERWPSHLIDDSLTLVHGVHVLDWDGDGRDEFLTASREGVHLFHATGKGENLRWVKTQLTPGLQESNLRRGSSEIDVGKVKGRRFLATIEPWHGEQVAVYFEAGVAGEWSRHVIDSSFRDGHALVCADLDGDGNDEIVAGFRGKGTSLYVYYASDAAGEKWERQTLDSQMAASCVVVTDLDGNGRLDIVAIGASTGNVKWYENLASRI